MPFYFCVFKWMKSWFNDSVLFSHSVVSDALRPHGLQRVRPPSPSEGFPEAWLVRFTSEQISKDFCLFFPHLLSVGTLLSLKPCSSPPSIIISLAFPGLCWRSCMMHQLSLWMPRMVVAEAFHKRVLTYNYIWSNSLDGNRPPKMFEIIIDAAFWWSVVKKKNSSNPQPIPNVK